MEKAAKRFENFDEQMFRSTNGRVVEYRNKIEEINSRFKNALEKNDLAEVKQIILDLEIVCPVSGTRNWTDVRQFNLMFSTSMGSLSEEAGVIYLRPETAQGIFVNFLNVQKTGRMKIPFGIAQTGKAFRNEIVARQFIFRMREFEQMEMQFFVKPGTEMEWYHHWKAARMKWHHALGFPPEKYRFHDHIKLAHYANAACDIEFDFPFGFKELEGIHSRTDFDLKSHEKFQGRNYSTSTRMITRVLFHSLLKLPSAWTVCFYQCFHNPMQKKSWKMAPRGLYYAFLISWLLLKWPYFHC